MLFLSPRVLVRSSGDRHAGLGAAGSAGRDRALEGTARARLAVTHCAGRVAGLHLPAWPRGRPGSCRPRLSAAAVGVWPGVS